MTSSPTPAPVETMGRAARVLDADAAAERPARVCRFVPAWALVVLVATLVSVVVNAGPGVAALVDYATRADTSTAAAPSAPLASPVAASEDQPGWDCRSQGNRWCGPGVDGGPVTDASGWTSCPRGGDLYDVTTGDVAPGVVSPGLVCRYDGGA